MESIRRGRHGNFLERNAKNIGTGNGMKRGAKSTQKLSRKTSYLESGTLMELGALNKGGFDQFAFYAAFYAYQNNSIEESLLSLDPVVRLFAIMDKRVGKTTVAVFGYYQSARVVTNVLSFALGGGRNTVNKKELTDFHVS